MATTTPSNGAPAPILYRIPEAAAALGIGRSKFYELVDGGEIQTVRVGRRVLVHRDELERFATALLEAR